jgi:glycosyltransferase involved in cell wall biosynthesis
MRLLMLNNEFPPLGGGTGTVNQAMLQYFSRVPDLEIDLVTSAMGSQFERQVFSDRITLYRVPVRNKNIHHSSNRELIEYFVRGFFFATKLQRRRPYNLCFAWSGVPAGAIALLLRRIFGLRYILRSCGPDIPGFERRYGAMHFFLAPLIRRVWRRADRLVAKSTREIELIHAVDPDVQCWIVPNGVDTEKFKPSAAPASGGPLRLLCVGRLIERKGQHHLIAAVKRLVDEGLDVTLDLIGTGDAQAANQAQVARLGLGDRVRFHGYVPREKIVEAYGAADLFVLPSYNEGMSVALLEAMASGLAVIVTPTGGTPELVEDGVDGRVFPWADVDILSNHLRQLIQDRSQVRRMGAAARARAAGFSWEVAARQYLAMFKELLAYQSKPTCYLHAEAKN